MATQNLQDLPLWTTELQRLEVAVCKSDDDGVRARWESGKYLLSVRPGKRFPHGVRDVLTAALGIHRSELTARVKFATKFPTPEDLTTAISQFKSWYDLKQHGLTDTRRAKSNDHRASPPLQRVLQLLEDLDPATFGPKGPQVLARMAAHIERLREGVDALLEDVA